MSDARPISEHWFHRLKSATRDLIKVCGGVIRAGEIAHRSKSEVSRWQSVTDSDVIDLAAAIALEADCGMPLVTTVMAELNGRRLTDEVAAQSASSLLDRHADVLRKSAETATLMARALEDMTITPAEAELLDRAASEQEAALRNFRAGLAAVRGSGAAHGAAPVGGLRAV
ncbi:hypothetical protein GCM10007301_15250 [Azorhizobium oxalatiphilum]|uniref:Uncharacterized protein n=1 Tax=Azorhizobium oxalatiphilum TaxID=980631 RepID=A0A917BT78_9HYPH|nr:hypothetical protein [Azorhizobium oxalatiphilum]GGF56542.1 hypothetical protein GCM10007301_15250 [Azorhizobium oxalatiphilum]